MKKLISDFTPNEEYHSIANYVIRAMIKEYFNHNINVIVESYIPTTEIAKRYTILANRKDVKMFYYQLEAPLEIRAKRIAERQLAHPVARKLSKKRIKANDENYLKNKFAKAKVIDTHNLTPQQIVKIILKDIK